jgi:hypothetical protein
MTKPKKKTPSLIIDLKQAELAQAWTIHFGLPYGAIKARHELLANKSFKADDTDFSHEDRLPHGLLFLKVHDALKVCLQTGHPDTSDSMIVGWFWDSFEHEENQQGIHSTPEWDEIEDGESIFNVDGDEGHEPDGMPFWNEAILERFHDHSRQGYLGLAVNGLPPVLNMSHEFERLQKIAKNMGDPFRSDTQGNETEAWELYFGLKRLHSLHNQA